ncbi:redoxin domain-containing protein [Campylobacter curvus]|uniref:redoxin domain-containing protein n=2 Tax=Campylobacter TaxID=194 RepID=UPI00146FF853|nr:redoxin domain-containing protein [Campylobacter curvus]MBN7288923.1 redoxin family protein [Campylobacter curvus]
MIKIPTSIHLKGLKGEDFDFSAFARTHDCVVFLYPKMGESGKFLSEQLKNTEGMTGCTVQAGEYKRLMSEFNELSFMVVAIGTQDLAEQIKFKEDTGAQFMFLNDADFALERALELPVFSSGDGKKFYFRQTLIIKSGKIVRADLVLKPQDDAKNALELIKNRAF